MAVGSTRVDGGWIEATQTLNPRWFLAERYDYQEAGWNEGTVTLPFANYYHRSETTVGFRVTPEITLRASYMTRYGYVVNFWDDQVLASIVFAKKIK
jgi:hypothetical protein